MRGGVCRCFRRGKASGRPQRNHKSLWSPSGDTTATPSPMVKNKMLWTCTHSCILVLSTSIHEPQMKCFYWLCLLRALFTYASLHCFTFICIWVTLVWIASFRIWEWYFMIQNWCLDFIDFAGFLAIFNLKKENQRCGTWNRTTTCTLEAEERSLYLKMISKLHQ